MQLNDLVYSDLYVAEDAASSWFKATPDSMINKPVPEDCYVELSQLRKKLEENAGASDFRIKWGEISLRVGKIPVSEGKIIYVCRRFRILRGSLSDLGVPAAVAAKLLSHELTEGLVVFMGKAGSGKTTTAGSFIQERLTDHGGNCWTVENPIELPLQGTHGKGICYQTEVGSDDEIGPAIRRLYRSSPNIIFIGEIRDGRAAREAIACATSGHLCIATFHASDLITGLARLTRMATEIDASVGLSDALKVAMHLTLRNAEAKPLPGAALTVPEPKGTGTPPRVLSVEPLWVDGPTAEALKSIVRDSDFQLLKSEIQRQSRAFMMSRQLPQ